MAKTKDQGMEKGGKGKGVKPQGVNPQGVNPEILGICLLAAGVYTAVSLFSPAGANLGGVVGKNLSWALVRIIGYTAYLFPFFILVIALKYLLRRVFSMSASVPICFAVFILSLASLFGLSASLTAGGAMGDWIAGALSTWLGTTGAFIFLVAIILIAVLVATGISLIQAGISLIPPTTAFARWLIAKIRGQGDEETATAEEMNEEMPGASLSSASADEEKARPEPTPPAIITPKTHQAGKKGLVNDDEDEGRLEITSPKGLFQLPPLALLDPVAEKTAQMDSAVLLENSKILERKLLDFGIAGRVIEVRPGPVVTMYEFEPAPGIKVNKITALSDDLALALKAMSIRIIAPIPGKAVVGIEIPNNDKEPIRFREMLESPAFAKSKSRLTLALGKDISGTPYVADLARMPHLLVAGATGTGKSVSVNAMITSILFKATPDDVRFLMVDPKMLELSSYEGIPHLITPVITDTKRAAVALKGMVAEMGRRYKLMAMKGAKNIEMYNRSIEEGEDDDEPGDAGDGHKRLPYIVVIIDELADLMMTSGKEVEECLVRLSQMARAAGIHLLVATQRPSVDVITGLIKTNFPARIAFQLPSKTDSRTILDAGGAETLLGQGDMLFLPPGTSKLMRLHGAYVSEAEVKKITEFWKNQGAPAYENVIIEGPDETIAEEDELGEEFMQRYEDAVDMASQLEMISTSYIQRRFRIGYNTAARIIEKMEKDGIVGPSQGSRPREVLKRRA